MFNSIVAFSKKNYIKLTLAFLIMIYLSVGIYQVNSLSLTFDEGSFFTYATRYLKGNPDRIIPGRDNSKMPVCVLNTLPRLIEQAFNSSLKKEGDGIADIVHGRYCTLFISIFIILLSFHWARQLYGDKAGLFAAFLVTFCPNTLGNSVFVTTDSYSSLALLTVLYLLWKFCNTKKITTFCFLCVAVAISQLVKQSLFHLYIIVPFILLIYFVATKTPIKFISIVKYFFIFIFINWFFINAGYYFYKTSEPFGSYHFMSRFFQTIDDIVPAKLPCPLPRPFIEGLDMAKYYDQIGGGFYNISSFGKVAIVGNESVGGSFWYYYFVSIFYKTPISYFIFIIGSLIFITRFTSWRNMLQKELFIIIPVCYYLIAFSFFYKTQCGIRHIIFIYPPLFVMASALCTYIKTSMGKALIVLACFYLMGSTLFYYQNSYSYTNEFILDKKMAYKYVGSSLDYGQGWFYFYNYLAKHPEVKLAPETKAPPGLYLISVADYMDGWNLHKYDWLKNKEPVGQVGYCGLIFKVD